MTTLARIASALIAASAFALPLTAGGRDQGGPKGTRTATRARSR